MLLSHNRLVELVALGAISGVKHEQINSASIDITLGDKIMRELSPYDYSGRKFIELSKRQPLDMGPAMPDPDGVIWIEPGEFVLAQSQQIFNLPNNISAEYKLKSSMARIGLEHLNAGWCDAGWNGSVLTLELKNMTRRHAIGLRAGDAIGQIVFFEHEPVPADRSYAARGRYNNDKQVEGIKP